MHMLLTTFAVWKYPIALTKGFMLVLLQLMVFQMIIDQRVIFVFKLNEMAMIISVMYR